MAQKKISYSDAITEIEKIISEIESESIDVDQLTVKVQRVAELIASCKQKLKRSEEEIEKIINSMEETDE